eukprot:GFKZ01013426.1.p1 GENE.GFKZ01013426.1~~GFKZ01013426.1.p1  ORF type:complete len:218 (+),score=54.30 GFKZ01013426.1:173-826(+)
MLERTAAVTDNSFDPQEAAYKRIQAQEWVGTALDELCAAMGDLHAAVTSERTAESPAASISSLVGPGLAHCDSVSLASQLAAGHTAVCATECQDWKQNLGALQAEIVAEEAAVRQLRDTLEREKKLAERRAQYEAVAKVILKEPSVEESEKELNEAKAALENVEDSIRSIEKVKEGMSKELRLFWHCTSGLDAFSDKIKALQVEEEQEEGEAMEISR